VTGGEPPFSVLLAAAAVAAFVVGFLKTSLGGGIGLILAPTLSLVLPPSAALGLIAPLMVLTDPFAIRYYWRVWDARQLRLLLPTSLVGVAAGTWVLSILSELALRRAIGVVALTFALGQLMLTRSGRSLFGPSPHAAVGIAVGFLTGFASTIAHSGGLVAGLYLIGLGLSNALVVGTGAAIYAIADLLKLAGYWHIGFVDRRVLLAALVMTPVLVAGAWLGVRANRRLPRRAFELILVAIAIAGSLRLLLSR
jgi:uncharacterized membrane protein YfcA